MYVALGMVEDMLKILPMIPLKFQFVDPTFLTASLFAPTQWFHNNNDTICDCYQRIFLSFYHSNAALA